MRNKCLAILSMLMITCTSSAFSEDLILEKIIAIDHGGLFHNYGGYYTNKNGYVVCNNQGYIWPDVYGTIINYSDKTLDGGLLRLNQTLTDSLLELGFEPTVWKAVDGTKWNGKIFVNFGFCSHGVDDFGNAIVSFAHVGLKDSNNQYPRKLCVWNLNKGFRLVPIEGIDDIRHIEIRNGILLIGGLNEDRSIERTSIFSLENGLWPDEKTEVTKPEPEKSWWEKIRPFLWPK